MAAASCQHPARLKSWGALGLSPNSPNRSLPGADVRSYRPSEMDQKLLALLDVVYSTASPDAKRQAEGEIWRLYRTQDALGWAAVTLQGAQGDHRLLFCAAAALEEAALRGPLLGPDLKAALRQCLWHGVLASPQLPHFVVGKLAAALAHVACTDWPHAYPEYFRQLQAALADLATLDSALILLAATVEHFQALAQSSSAGLKGKVSQPWEWRRRLWHSGPTSAAWPGRH